MESAAEALQMAAAVLIFVLALSISINAFGEVRQTSQTILDYKDREYDYTYVEESESRERYVGIETIIPTIYKAYKEHYKIVFDVTEIENLYSKIDSEGHSIKIKHIDLDEEGLGLGLEKDKRKFIEAILYGANTAIQTEFKKRGITLPDQNNGGLYETIKNMKLKESIGIYYQDELYENDESSTKPETNREEKRVITYSKE